MSELSDRAIDEIQNAVETKILKDESGNEFSTRKLFPIAEKVFPLPSALKISTLTGFVDYCKNHPRSEEVESGPAFIHVVDHQNVCLTTEVFGPSKQQAVYVKACYTDLLGESFSFGQYYDQESFIVGLQSIFEPTPARAEVLRVIGTIKENQVREHSDDGVSQTVAAKSGVALVAEVQVPNPVVLKPYRTFREIEQPESPFILRVKQGPEKPLCALFEADGGKWKLEAIESIRGYLEAEALGYPVIA